MSARSLGRPARPLALLFALVGALVVAASASAAETFNRFEANATANYVVEETCADGSTVQTLVTVIGGHEQESENGVTTLDDEFLTVLLRGFDCDGNLINDRGFGTGEFTYTLSLNRASVTGTLTTREGRSVAVDMDWEATGPLDVEHNVTKFPGFSGHFTGKRRDAAATGTVVVDGETLVDGTTTNAEIETLEDRNRSTG
jgi:hypothetical protein